MLGTLNALWCAVLDGAGAEFYGCNGDVDLYILTQSGVANKLYENNGNSIFINVGGSILSRI